ncbi:MAG: hypothetical protein L0Y58_01155 [Verrucomicrobia subdivision 3 bacterium]|nr:hypothetical protein [Limisphaerales bacterium]
MLAQCFKCAFDQTVIHTWTICADHHDRLRARRERSCDGVLESLAQVPVALRPEFEFAAQPATHRTHRTAGKSHLQSQVPAKRERPHTLQHMLRHLALKLRGAGDAQTGNKPCLAPAGLRETGEEEQNFRPA